MKDRIIKYDNLKGILIILVVLGHLLLTTKSILTNNIILFIYTFHMPLFIIISGYFSKNKINKKTIIELLLLFIIMNISFILYDFITLKTLNITMIKYSSWYILLILIYRIFISNNKIKNIINNNIKIVFIISLLISLLIPLLPLNIFILRLFSNWIYFYFGYLLIKKDYYKDINLLHKKSYLLLIIIFILIMIFTINIYNNNLDFYLGYSYINYTDIIFKITQIFINILLFIILINNISNNKIPLITRFGYNSLYIYFYHRIPTLIISFYIIPNNIIYIIIDIFISIIICIIFSNKYIVDITKKIISNISNKYINEDKVIYIITVILIIISIIFIYNYNYPNNKKIKYYNKNKEEISIGFIGDLILLEKQIDLSKDKLGYNFDYMFKYTSKYFKNTDYVIGVFEGVSDDNKSYSQGNYNDNKKLFVNHPSTFIDSIKKSGIDLVTTANNHVYDRGYNSTIKTINNLNRKGLDFVGTGTNNPQRIIRNINGLKIGFLAYTYSSNYKSDYKELVKYLIDPEDKNKFNKQKELIKEDFKYLKNNKVDYIIVLPHYGYEFNFDFSNYQDKWNEVFTEYGANIILGDHSHVIGPIKYYNNTLAISSPGNYVNSYNGLDSDISYYAKININKKTKEIINTEIIPLLAQKDNKGYYPISLYDLNKKKKTSRIKQTLHIFGKVLFNNENIKLKKSYKIKKYKSKEESLSLTENDKKTTTYNLINSSNKICFIGDSITEGTKNNNHPWYEKLMNNFDKEIINISKGGYTSKNILEKYSNKIKESNCNLYIINIGTNDIRYNMTKEKEYIKNINKMIKLINNNSNIILLSPWETYSNDKIIGNNINIKKDLYGKYNKELIKVSDNNKNIYYINTNRYIKKNIYKYKEEKYLLDGVHPNNDLGISLYSYSVLRGEMY